MFYLIRINRRDKPHSRIGNDNAAKNNSCPGNERANFNFRKKPGKNKVPGTSKENSISICSTQTCGPEVVGKLRLEIKATKWPFHNSCPSPSPSQTNQPEVCRAG